jgi:hypothetical protein
MLAAGPAGRSVERRIADRPSGHSLNDRQDPFDHPAGLRRNEKFNSDNWNPTASDSGNFNTSFTFSGFESLSGGGGLVRS